MFKKIVVSLAIVATTVPAFADYDIYLKFKDGSHDVYKNVPDSMTPDQFALTVKQLSGKNFADADLDASMISSAGTVDYSQYGKSQQSNTSFWDSNAGKVTKVVLVIGGAYLLFKSMGYHNQYKGPCLNPSDIARNGSVCGARAATVRPGGAF